MPRLKSIKRRPLHEQKGLIADMARAWRRKYGFNPSWSGNDIIAFHSKRNINDHLTDAPYLLAFEIYLESQWWAESSHPLWGFTRHIDKYLGQVDIEEEDYADGTAEGTGEG